VGSICSPCQQFFNNRLQGTFRVIVLIWSDHRLPWLDKINIILAEGTQRCPGEIWILKNVFDLAHILFYKEFSKMLSSAFSILGPRGLWRGSNLYQNLPWIGGDVCAKLHQDWCRVWISISPPHTNRQTDEQTDKHLYAHFYYYYIYVSVVVQKKAMVHIILSERYLRMTWYNKTHSSKYRVGITTKRLFKWKNYIQKSFW